MTTTGKKPHLSKTQLLRRLIQVGFGLFIIASSIQHHVVTAKHLASIDAYCPFGGFETLWRWLSSGGLFVQRVLQTMYPRGLVRVQGRGRDWTMVLDRRYSYPRMVAPSPDLRSRAG